MSYILEALKKSEKERQRGTVPNLMTAQDGPVERPRRRHLWTYLIVGGLIVNAGLVVWWLAGHPGKRNIPRPSATPQEYAVKAPSGEERPQESAVAGKPVAGAAEMKRPSSRSDVTSAGVAAPPAGVAPQPRQEEARTGVQQTTEQRQATTADAKDPAVISPASPQQPATSKRAENDTQSVSYPPPQKDKLYRMQELPAAVRQNLPDFAVSTHLYTDDAPSRMVRINGQLLREGQFLAAELKLEEITPEGVIFSYHNYRFRVGLK
jgi:general secretion pathway protein B